MLGSGQVAGFRGLAVTSVSRVCKEIRYVPELTFEKMSSQNRPKPGFKGSSFSR